MSFRNRKLIISSLFEIPSTISLERLLFSIESQPYKQRRKKLRDKFEQKLEYKTKRELIVALMLYRLVGLPMHLT
jgi:hypothetical protein